MNVSLAVMRIRREIRNVSDGERLNRSALFWRQPSLPENDPSTRYIRRDNPNTGPAEAPVNSCRRQAPARYWRSCVRTAEGFFRIRFTSPPWPAPDPPKRIEFGP